jgi:predicted DNA-binding protein
MNLSEQRTYNAYIAFRAPGDFLERFQQFSSSVGRNRSAVARHLIGKCLTSYENDKVAIAKIRQEIL